MAGILSRLRPSFSAVTQQANIPVNVTPLRSISGHPLISRITWIYGSLFLLLLLLLLAAMAVSIRHTRHSTAQMEIAARIQMHNQRLTKAAQQTILGNQAAFKQLQDSQNQSNDYITLLTRGGVYRGNTISPINEASPALLLKTYTQKWHLAEKKINLILNNQDALITLGRIIHEVNTTNSQLLRLFEQLTKQMEQMGGLSNEIIAVETMKVLTQSITKNISIILPSEFPISAIKGQLINDRKRLLTIIHALSQGSNELHLSAIKEQDSLKILTEIQILYRKINDRLDIIQREIAKVIATKFAINEIFKSSETILSIGTEFDNELQKQAAVMVFSLNAIIYASGTLALLICILFARALTQNMRKQLLASENEVERTQKAILRLLDDMEKLADGDLTIRTVVTEDITGAIADSINYTIEELHTLVEEVNKASSQVATASSQAQHVSSKLLTAAQQQSLKIEETTIAVLGMAESISEVSETATESAKVAKQSLATAEKGTLAVRESIAGMKEIRTHIQDTSKRIKRLGESSQEIGEMVALISNITEQTNVLALNAAIQAASAGEAGRGFTVIAREVQRLAERSAAATKQISSLVKTIQEDTRDTVAAMERSTLGVAKGAKRSDSAGQALEEIEEVSKRLAQLVSTIFDTTHAQAQAANKVVENMEDILHITRQTTDGTMQTTASIKQITGFASELKASVSNFKV
ncbi:twitching motility protein PilJ [Nitrosomonas cryotolerans]|uniref:Twitching motility protein PilJ n=1 Tax=Nitrosomonas cryotolerans ATCC 49181 TaxID=1131553 RepID=A0A1N6FKS1_9PROT|nr:methyl-accepting chemotaxis protein [Nitrosomonas cryotolerans]SFP82255.1 twitching motility protein PilJ [Nitrosomonas cryotolerans]SIN95844.1 twitching motility protein PilJ [Nitrosomonas cryotolerans ATCC 49181]